MAEITTTEVMAEVDRPPQISWGAVIAGLVFVISSSWLMLLLGSAVGVSIIDASDGAAVGEGLSTGALVWIVLTSVVAFFLGGLLTGRLTGKGDDTVGMLHGMTLWGIGTALMIVLTYGGVGNLVQTGQSLVSGVVSATGSTAGALQNAAAQAADTSLLANVQARLKRRAAELLSQAEASGGAEVSQQEARQAIRQLDPEVARSVSQRLLVGDTQGAQQALANSTNLSEQQVEELVTGITQAVTQAFGQPGGGNLLQTVQQTVERSANEFIAGLDQPGDGASLSQTEVSRAVDQLDGPTLQAIGLQLIQGNTQAAKDTLAANTNLSEDEINTVIDGVSADVQEQIDAVQAQAAQAAEAASSYASAVLWGAFVASAIGLIVSIFGGWLGAEATRRLYVVGVETRVSS